jgi:hypothetical protein
MDTTRDVPIGLNENHLRRVFATCQYTNKLLVAIEAVLGTSASDAFFHAPLQERNALLAPIIRPLPLDRA